MPGKMDTVMWPSVTFREAVQFNPHSTLTWALGIWMFFLIQSLYFTVMTDMGEDNVTPPVDAFEQARIKADGILKN